MGALYDVLVNVSPVHDPEMLDGYRRYEALLDTILTPAQMETYANSVQQAGSVRIFAEMNRDELEALSAEERSIALAVIANGKIELENRRVASLLNQRGQHDVAPDLDWNK